MRLFARRFLATLAMAGGILSGVVGVSQASHDAHSTHHGAAHTTVASRGDWWW